ncbi:hypothetical protein TDB9533_00835 [Thalassocella blandensis]|nr:hypothetical protein TDB9533_00835 [Thalassocella blandensis]
MTRTTTAIMMIFWLLCQQAVAGVVAYNMFPPMPTEHGQKNAIHCQESTDTETIHHTTEYTTQSETVSSVLTDEPVHPHDSTHDCCDRDCQCCIGNCTTHLVLSGYALHFKTVTQSATLYFANAAPVPGIHSLFRPPILS